VEEREVGYKNLHPLGVEYADLEPHTFETALFYDSFVHKKTFRYRLYPTPAQERVLQSTLNECRWLYNKLLEERRNAYEKTGKGVPLYLQINRTNELKKDERPSLKEVHSQVLQNVAVRIDLAFKAFFRRVKAKVKPGYPRFRGDGRYDSFTYPQSGFRVEKLDDLGGGGRVFLSKVGRVKAAIHRPLEGKVKTATVRRTAAGKWYVTFSCEVDLEPLPESAGRVGVDVGLDSFATLSDGEKIENPRFFRKEEKALARASRRFSEAERDTMERVKRRKVVARVHERIANRRRDFAHKASRKLVDRYSFLAVEDLSINRMNKSHCLAKRIMDAAWGEFTQKLSYKAEWAGRTLVKVAPAYTSQDCSGCGRRRVALPLSEKVYRCARCGLEDFDEPRGQSTAYSPK
jgi:putative transposase